MLGRVCARSAAESINIMPGRFRFFAQQAIQIQRQTKRILFAALPAASCRMPQVHQTRTSFLPSRPERPWKKAKNETRKILLPWSRVCIFLSKLHFPRLFFDSSVLLVDSLLPFSYPTITHPYTQKWPRPTPSRRPSTSTGTTPFCAVCSLGAGSISPSSAPPSAWA
jgi:hypothetical protein